MKEDGILKSQGTHLKGGGSSGKPLKKKGMEVSHLQRRRRDGTPPSKEGFRRGGKKKDERKLKLLRRAGILSTGGLLKREADFLQKGIVQWKSLGGVVVGGFWGGGWWLFSLWLGDLVFFPSKKTEGPAKPCSPGQCHPPFSCASPSSLALRMLASKRRGGLLSNDGRKEPSFFWGPPIYSFHPKERETEGGTGVGGPNRGGPRGVKS